MVSYEPFGIALTDLVRELEDIYVTARGLKITTFAEVLPGITPYELGAAVSGARAPSERLMEECARFLRVKPDYFMEYRRLARLAAA
jgi:hypothetical protein